MSEQESEYAEVSLNDLTVLHVSCDRQLLDEDDLERVTLTVIGHSETVRTKRLLAFAMNIKPFVDFVAKTCLE